jgi:hypothetical protein
MNEGGDIRRANSITVMPGLVPGIHVFIHGSATKNVDGWDMGVS